MIAPRADDLEAIQGLVYTGWNDHGFAGFVFATLGDDATASRAWLERVHRDVTPASRHLRGDRGRLQIAIAPSGLAALGVPDDVIAMFAPEAQAGMASRWRALGDPEPAGWPLGRLDQRLDVVVMVYARTPEARAHQLAAQRSALTAARARVYDDELGWPLGPREHFGFADGLSQPHLPGLHVGARKGEDTIAAGEILLGYPNAYDQHPITPLWGDFDLGRNGSYLVFRKLHQDVAGFWGWIADQARRHARGDAEVAQLTELLGAKLMGRWRGGASLVVAPERDPGRMAADRVNAFKYLADDPDGLCCPISSHVRRANPRDSRAGGAAGSETVVSRHRILRRGRSFGAPLADDAARAGRDDGVSRGLYFVCLQSSIARGFEFLQQSWLANPSFQGLHHEVDPIVGNSAGNYHFTIPRDPLALRLINLPTVVTTLGGGYFFLPSLPALARIAAGPAAR